MDKEIADKIVEKLLQLGIEEDLEIIINEDGVQIKQIK